MTSTEEVSPIVTPLKSKPDEWPAWEEIPFPDGVIRHKALFLGHVEILTKEIEKLLDSDADIGSQETSHLLTLFSFYVKDPVYKLACASHESVSVSVNETYDEACKFFESWKVDASGLTQGHRRSLLENVHSILSEWLDDLNDEFHKICDFSVRTENQRIFLVKWID